MYTIPHNIKILPNCTN
uniref:Uncharacterized protein n=1 Tax=Arundo donax TaxID=35708 RepID=A0A0A9EDZ7_ARUDO